MTRRVVVLGADGFIGSHVLEALAACPWAAPVAVGRRAAGTSTADNVTRAQLDARDAGALAEVLRNADAVVNCVAGDAATLVGSTRALLSAASQQSRPPLLVHLSSMAVYGGEASGLIDEDAPLLGADPYARAKIEGEQAVRGYGGPSVILRPGIVYGPRGAQWTLRIAHWLRQRRIGDLGAAGDGLCNLVYAGDVAQAAMQAILSDQSHGTAFNLSLPEPPTWNEYLIRYARALGFVPVARISARWLTIETKLLAPPLKVTEILARKAHLRGMRLPEAIPPSFLRLCRQEIRLDVARAEKALGLQWTALDEGLRRAAQWFRQSAT